MAGVRWGLPTWRTTAWEQKLLPPGGIWTKLRPKVPLSRSWRLVADGAGRGLPPGIGPKGAQGMDPGLGGSLMGRRRAGKAPQGEGFEGGEGAG